MMGEQDFMAQSIRPSGIPLFKIFGIQVSLHWMWILAVMYFVETSKGQYTNIGWAVAECMCLFAIVLMHEFGHALACRSVGGRADNIMLWPLGGVAFVDPPPRPGAYTWSIVAGPLVNVILLPVTIGLCLLVGTSWGAFINHLPMPDLDRFLITVALMNAGLLIFNLLPIFPLDGGQILRGILWFMVGAGRSLMIASIIGMIGAAAGVVLAALTQDWWLVLIALFAAMQSWVGFQRSKSMRLVSDAPRRQGVRCPACGNPPPIGPLWTCPCGQSFDTFETQARCPRCGGLFMTTTCPTCRTASPAMAWYPAAFPVQPVAQAPPPSAASAVTQQTG
jgi:Zn-dependent protease